MNITNTNNYPQNQYNRNITKNNTTFTGAFPKYSSFLAPFNRQYTKLTDGIANKYTDTMYLSPVAGFIAKHLPKNFDVISALQVLGSSFISGMYMYKSVHMNSNVVDDDRKKTLAINQFLTWAISTGGSLLIDSSLEKKWNNLTLKYASNRLNDKDFKTKYEKFVKTQKNNKKLNKSIADFLNCVDGGCYDTTLAKRVTGMGIFKKLLVFGTIYRFITPVAVTPLASFIGKKLEEHRKAKAAELAQKKIA